MKTLKNIFIILAISIEISCELFGQEYIYPNIPKNIHNDFILDFYLDKNLIKNYSFSDFDESILRLKSENGIIRYGIIQRNYSNEKPFAKRYNNLYKYGNKYVEEWIRIIPLEGYNSMFGKGDWVIVSGVQYDSYNQYPIQEYFDFEDKRMYKYLFTIADILDKLQLKTVTDFKQSFTNKWHRYYTNKIYLENLYRDYNSRIVTNYSGDFRKYKYNGYDIKINWEIDDSGKKSKILKRDVEYKNNILIYTNIIYLNYTNDKGKIKTKKLKLEKERGTYYSELENKYLDLYNHSNSGLYLGYLGYNPSYNDLKHNFIEITNDVDKLFISNLEKIILIKKFYK